MERQPIESGNLKSIGYDSAGKVLEVEFRTGAVYRYNGVPVEYYAGLLTAESVGSFFHENIRGRFAHEKVG